MSCPFHSYFLTLVFFYQVLLIVWLFFLLLTCYGFLFSCLCIILFLMENDLLLVVFFNSELNPLRNRWRSRHLKRRNLKELKLGVRSPPLWKLILFLFIVGWHSLSFISKYDSSLISLGNEGHFSQVLPLHFPQRKMIFYTTLSYLNYGIKILNGTNEESKNNWEHNLFQMFG